jgi:predicted nuclease with TOPRIM domain
MNSPITSDSNTLLRQNQELRQRLQDESNGYRRRLETYKQAQSNQSALVSRLQAKVLQYKQRCAELENQMNETTAICPQLEPSKILGATPISTVYPKTSINLTTSAAPLSLPTICQPSSTATAYCSDESDESFERKRIEEERKL